MKHKFRTLNRGFIKLISPRWGNIKNRMKNIELKIEQNLKIKKLNYTKGNSNESIQSLVNNKAINSHIKRNS